jgi:hypothetical protein
VDRITLVQVLNMCFSVGKPTQLVVLTVEGGVTWLQWAVTLPLRPSSLQPHRRASTSQPYRHRDVSPLAAARTVFDRRHAAHAIRLSNVVRIKALSPASRLTTSCRVVTRRLKLKIKKAQSGLFLFALKNALTSVSFAARPFVHFGHDIGTADKFAVT